MLSSCDKKFPQPSSLHKGLMQSTRRTVSEHKINKRVNKVEVQRMFAMMCDWNLLEPPSIFNIKQH